MNSITASSDFERFGRSTRFAVACVVFGISYFSIRVSLSISHFESIFRDMLSANERLPTLTLFVLQARAVLIAISMGIPLAGIALLFTKNITRSLYGLGILVLLALGEDILIFHALWSPLGRIITSMSTVPG